MTPPATLWTDSPEAAVCVALRAQPQSSIWRRLAVACTESCSGADTEKGRTTVPVLAGMVCSCLSPQDEVRRFICVSLGSGTRCCGSELQFATNPLLRTVVIGDGHAEVLARRGALAFFLDAAEWVLRHWEEAAHPLLALSPSSAGALEWVRGVRLHLVVTQWPCGFLARLCASETGSRLILRTPCAPFSSDEISESSASEEHVFHHVLAAHKSEKDVSDSSAFAARVKPGRGKRNLHMSCSDKIWRWNVCGAQGQRRRLVIPTIPLFSLHVGVGDGANVESAQALAQEAMDSAHSLRSSVLTAIEKGAPSLRVSVFYNSMLDPATPSHATPGRGSAVPQKKNIDCGYSRAVWLRHDVQSTSRKRPREEALSRVGFLWESSSAGAAAPPVRSGVVVNTKNGFPQGFPASDVSQRYPELAESFVLDRANNSTECQLASRVHSKTAPALRLFDNRARDFLLSRAWMLLRTMEIQEMLEGGEKQQDAPSSALHSVFRQFAITLSCGRRPGSSDPQERNAELLWTYKPRLGDVVL